MICEHREGETFFLDTGGENWVVWCEDCGALREDGKWREPKRPRPPPLVAQGPLPGEVRVTVLGGLHPTNWARGIKP